MEKDPKRRWQTIADVRMELDRLLASGLTTVAEAAAASFNPWKLAPWIAAALLLGAVAAWTIKPAPPPEPKPMVRFDYVVPQTQAFRNTGRALVALSPDGRHFVYNAIGGLYLRSMNSLTARIIPGTEESLMTPSFSPDGDWVVRSGGPGHSARFRGRRNA